MECEETVERPEQPMPRQLMRFQKSVTSWTTSLRPVPWQNQTSSSLNGLNCAENRTSPKNSLPVSQLTRVTPKLKFVAQEYQLHYEVQLIDQHLSFQMYRSKYVPFDTTHGTFVLNHMDTIQLIDPM